MPLPTLPASGSTSWYAWATALQTLVNTLETLSSTQVSRVIHNGTSYPARPSGVAAGYVEYIGPTEPTTWLTGDTWIERA